MRIKKLSASSVDKNLSHFVRSILLIGIGIFLVVVLSTAFLNIYYLDISRPPTEEEYPALRRSRGERNETVTVIGPCAINFYGLPRQFQAFVLPSLIENTVRPNQRYHCDYFIHYYNRSTPVEDPLRDARGADFGRGGLVQVEQIFALQAALEAQYSRIDVDVVSTSQQRPRIQFVETTDEDFLQYYQKFLPKLHSARWKDSSSTDGTQSLPLYIPTSEAEPFSNATLYNILKMWLGQEAVWQAMEESGQHYSRVAMFRNDMLYVTPIDIYRLPGGNDNLDLRNEVAVVPGFANFPVNDRMIYGPYDAVRIWASGRLSRLRDHARRVAPLGHGIHDEQFLQHSIFPAIRQAGIPIVTAPVDLCFLRVRSDQSIRMGDCGRACVNSHNQGVVEDLLQRNCRFNTSTWNPDVTFLECPDALQEEAHTKRRKKNRIRTWRPCAWNS